MTMAHKTTNQPLESSAFSKRNKRGEKTKEKLFSTKQKKDRNRHRYGEDKEGVGMTQSLDVINMNNC